MRPFRALLALSLALLAVAALAPAAGAATTPSKLSPEAEFEVAGTNGFKVHFTVSRNILSAVAAKGPAVVSYTAPTGRARDDLFTGTLPGIGRVSVRFHQHGKAKRVAILCPKTPTIIRPGFFVGTIRLRGEQGYTTVRATQAAGAVSESPGPNCGRSRKRRQTALMRAMAPKKTQFLSIQAKAGNVTFLGGQIEGSEKLGLSILGASHTRIHDGMLVENAVIEFGSAPAVLVTEDLEFPKNATVQPAAPFSGSAAFELHDSHSSSWTGDLAAELPGIGTVRLAGPRFRSELCVAKHCGGSLPPDAGDHRVQIIH